jgi:hypothetical protein
MGAFLGMRGTGDWVTDQRPKSWREMLLYLYPNGDMPLTAILSKMGSEQVTDPEFNWWQRRSRPGGAWLLRFSQDIGLSAGGYSLASCCDWCSFSVRLSTFSGSGLLQRNSVSVIRFCFVTHLTLTLTLTERSRLLLYLTEQVRTSQ